MRTQNSIKNILTTIVPFVIIGILGFVKVRVFVAFLQDDLYSLNQLFYQVFSYLSLAEAGFGLFVIQKYYKLLADKNQSEIKKTFANSLTFFRLVGVAIVTLSLGLSFVIPFLTKAQVSVGYIQAIFVLFIVKNSIDYFMMSPRFVIAADQKMFKINLWINLFKILEITTEIALVYLGIDYLWMLVPGIGIRIVANAVINQVVYRDYPYLKAVQPRLDVARLKGVSHILAQRIVGIFHSNTDIILISSLVSPVAVIAYTSYTYLTKFVFDLTYMTASAVNASLAHAINTSKQSIKKIFEDLQAIFILEASIVSIGFYVFLNIIIKLWVGEKYLINELGLVTLLTTLYLQITLRPFYMMVDSEGFFKETKRMMIAEAIINLLASVVLIGYFGLAGVLLGTLVSIVLTSLWYLPRFIYRKMFTDTAWSFWAKLIINFSLTVVGALMMRRVFEQADSLASLLMQIIIGGLLTVVYVLLANYRLLNLKSLIDRLKFLRESRSAES